MRVRSAERVTEPPAFDARSVLVDGARMDRKTFHALYLRTPDGFKAELIGGVVYVASPVSLRHGKPHSDLIHWLVSYRNRTPGTGVGDNTTNILGEQSEPQPDAFLLVLPGSGGQTSLDEGGYVVGPPELVAEVAHTTKAVDLGAKKADYEAAGVGEYLVIDVAAGAVRWFVRRRGKFAEQKPGPDGLLRSAVFPGLWLDPAAFLADQPRKLAAALRAGLASPEHKAFVADLKARRKRTKPAKKPRTGK
ncbi:MAG: Uma2 family endonuclease [Gemmataceae bacterium]|nr:Uma2 family endonuclease [Gemmataceae bacterium]